MGMTITVRDKPVRIDDIALCTAERVRLEMELGAIFAGFDGNDTARLRPHERRIVALQEHIVYLSEVEQAWAARVEQANDRLRDENILSVWRQYRAWRADDAARVAAGASSTTGSETQS